MSYICLARDIKEGEYAPYSSFGSDVIVKKEKNKLTVAENKCRHRGFKVTDCRGSGTIKCQYHGQRFNYESLLRHHEFGEFIFIPSFLGGSQFLKDLTPNMGGEYGAVEQDIKAPFHLWMQNTMDVNHLSIVHGDGFAKLFDTMRVENQYISEFESSFTLQLKDEVRDKYAKYGNPESELFKNGWTHYMAFPNLSVTSFLGIFLSVEHVEPTLTGCKVTTRFFTGKDLKIPTLLTKLAMDQNIKILTEDKEIVEKWALGYSFNDEVEWLPGEARIRSYAREIQSRGFCT